MKIIILILTLSFSVQLQAKPWKTMSNEKNLQIYGREKDGTDIKELKATGIINAPHWACYNVVTDEGHFTEFMPYMKSSRVIKDSPQYKLVYQRISAPFVSDRDYTIKIKDKSTIKNDKKVYKVQWHSVSNSGPKKVEDVVRVPINDGYWQFEALSETKTKVTYYIYTDPQGSLPTFIINGANERAVPGVFEAVSKQARSAKYQKNKPAPIVKQAPPISTQSPPIVKEQPKLLQ